MVRKQGRRRSKRVEEDPMAGTSNLVDAMLVIAVGFLVFVIISWNMQAMIDPTQNVHEQMQQKTTEVDQGQQLNETPDTSNSSGQGYSGWNTDGGNNTEDRIFLLSYAEANRYLGVTYDDISNTKSRVTPTAYALAQGAYTSDSNKTEDGAAAGFWWLRSPGFDPYYAAGVKSGGSLGSSINISTNAGAQLASDLGKGLIQGTSQYIAKKMRTVKVHLKAGYKVMLYQDRD